MCPSTSPRGNFTTSPLPIGLRTFDAELDLRDHVLVIRTSDGQMERRPLGGAVADFYRDVMDALRRMGIDVAISVHPSEVPDPIPFPDDHTHVTYDRAQVLRFQHVLSMIDMVMKEHRARFRGRTTPVQFFWGTFDLALTRYSGKLVEPLPGDSVIAHFGSDAEEVCAGWWPGDHRVPSATFFSYAYPAPPDISAVTVRPTRGRLEPGCGRISLPVRGGACHCGSAPSHPRFPRLVLRWRREVDGMEQRLDDIQRTGCTGPLITP